MKYVNSANKPIFSWCNNPESGAIDQAKNLANLPFLFKHVALMPDTHQGYGMPIGGVIACEDVIIPNAVGVDIGCGMLAVRTSLKELNTEDLKNIMGLIRKVVPVGFKHQEECLSELLMPDVGKFNDTSSKSKYICIQQYDSARKQLGTLGGGNHFIEIQKGSDGYIWFMIHSGSRNLGLKVAKHYNDIAKELNEKWHSSVPKNHDLAYLPVNSQEAKDYISEMNFCLEFAYNNRQCMSTAIKTVFRTVTKCVFGDEVNIHHNYARLENHFGKNVWIHRKGATSAKEEELGIIPGSQGTASYIVKGLGNTKSFKSCSHGAGRKLSRSKAKQTLDLEEEQKKLEDRGIIHSVRDVGNLDEASGAYKDIDVVMEEQKDLVDIVVKLEPMGVIKG